ncbi:MAG: DNA topoisomerase (ATP-hydrolyzing) subunit A [Clostridiales bacterium]|nr:DNA topoisomerase (ATP-hydrolyzing) subunit A [Clostridiales bacterium]
MAKKRTPKQSETYVDKYTEQPITDTLELNYMPYAMSVIVSRAIPQIDGFKPAHRKLLYTMYKMGLLNGARTKSTNVVGQTMKLNPHGDAAIYETMVRLTRGNGALLHPFVDSKGNFGKVYSRDMAYAASRYTEVKLDSFCTTLFKDIDKNTVEFVDNFDGSMQEPVLFPVSFPNVLVTPNQGIAVSMASQICSFNLGEICRGTAAYIKNKNVDLMEYIKAPDFSTGGELIYDKKELSVIYETGRGSFKVRAKYRSDKKLSLIEVYEIPYSTNIEAITDKIIQLVKTNKIKEINDVRNETDLNGLKITIDIKRNTDPDRLMEKLFKMTPLCDSFNCNFNILVDGRPKVMGIKEILDNWISFRTDCIKKRTAYELEKKKEQYHLLSGLNKIIVDIDFAIQIIRETEKESMVIPNLMEGFNIDQPQAEFIAEIKLRNLNREYLLNKVKDMQQLEKDIAELQGILSSDTKIKNIICRDLKEVEKKYGAERRTDIVFAEDVKAAAPVEVIEDYGVKLFLTKENYFKKITLNSLRLSGEHRLKEDDEIAVEIETTNNNEVMFFSDKQAVYKVKVYDLAECKASVMGSFLNNILPMESDEKIVFMAVPGESYAGEIVFAFENGKAAKVPMEAYKTKLNRKRMINAYSDKSKLVGAKHILKDECLIFIRDDNKAMAVDSSLIPLKTTKNTQGVQVFTLKKNSVLKAMMLASEAEGIDPKAYRQTKIPSTGKFIKGE